MHGRRVDRLMTLDVKPEIAAALEALAAAQGLSVEDYLQQLVERELPASAEGTSDSNGSGMVWENGLLVYRTGRAVSQSIIDDLIQRGREERARRILGGKS